MSMRGLHILTRTLSIPVPIGAKGEAWQYHPRSDRHSKIACWAILFDLLNACPLLARHAADNKVCFGINHEMRDFRMNRSKNLDLVLCTPGTTAPTRKRKPSTLIELAKTSGIRLDGGEAEALRLMPVLNEGPVGVVHIALEAKACMTEHQKARPRLYDELNSSQQTVHGASDMTIAAGFVMVNLAEEFLSPTRDRVLVTKHRQPFATEQVIQKIRELPRRTTTGEQGFDALGIAVVDCENDPETPVRLVENPPAPPLDDIFHYDQTIRRVAQLYEARFPRI